MIESDFLEKKNNALVTDLKKIPTLKPFNETELNKLLQMSKIRKFKPGELICKEGYHDSFIYFLVNGSVKIAKHNKELTLLKRRGDVFGEMGAIDGAPRSASVTAIDTTVCLATDTFYIKRLTGQDKIAFGYIIYKVFSEILAARLRVTNEELVSTSKKFGFGPLSNIFSKFFPVAKRASA